jgi:hypothetical protein
MCTCTIETLALENRNMGWPCLPDEIPAPLRVKILERRKQLLANYETRCAAGVCIVTTPARRVVDSTKVESIEGRQSACGCPCLMCAAFSEGGYEVHYGCTADEKCSMFADPSTDSKRSANQDHIDAVSDPNSPDYDPEDEDFDPNWADENDPEDNFLRKATERLSKFYELS